MKNRKKVVRLSSNRGSESGRESLNSAQSGDTGCYDSRSGGSSRIMSRSGAVSRNWSGSGRSCCSASASGVSGVYRELVADDAQGNPIFLIVDSAPGLRTE